MLAATTDISVWGVITFVVSICAGVVGGLVLYNLTGLKELINKVSTRQDDQDRRISDMQQTQAECKLDCERNMVSKEDWVRAEGYTRRMLEQNTATLNRLEGKLDQNQQIPETFTKTVQMLARELKEARQ